MRPSINKVNHINVLKKLRLPASELILLGSATLAAYGLVKKNEDIDALASPRLWRRLQTNHKGMEPVKKLGRLFFETPGGEVEMSYRHVLDKHTFPYLKKGAIKIGGYYFMSFPDLIDFYEAMRRPKDIVKLKIINDYLEKNRLTEHYLVESQLTYEDEINPTSVKDEFAPLWIDHIKYVNSIQNFPYKAPSKRMFEEKLNKSIKNSKKVVLFVVRDEGKMVGYIQTAVSKNGRSGKIVSFHLLTQYRRTGVGGELIKKGLKWLWKNGVRSIELGTQGGNEAAVKFYKKHGFEIQGYTLRHKKSKY